MTVLCWWYEPHLCAAVAQGVCCWDCRSVCACGLLMCHGRTALYLLCACGMTAQGLLHGGGYA